MKLRSKRYVGFSEYSFVSRRGKPSVVPPPERPAPPSLKRFPQAHALLESEAHAERDLDGTEFESGRVVAKRYALEERIGQGGMGEVWSVYDRRVGRRMALKLVDLVAADQPSAHARFIREATLARQLHGPAFAEVYDHGFVGDRAFMVMELLDGESLLERLRRVGRLTCPEALSLARGVADALRVAHALQIVHRDVKPSNVFFAREKAASSGVQALAGPREIVKLLDFGVAKSAWDDARLTRPDMLVGSAMYMSPEQIVSGRDVDTRADLWSLAVVLFRVVTGRRPFEGKGGEVLARIARDPALAPSALDATLPRQLDRFFERALAKDPRDRFPTVDELVSAFELALDGEDADDTYDVDEGERLAQDDRATVVHLRVASRRPGPPPLPSQRPSAGRPAPALAGLTPAPQPSDGLALEPLPTRPPIEAHGPREVAPAAGAASRARGAPRVVVIGAAVVVGAAFGAAIASGEAAELMEAIVAVVSP
ncbi:MAG: serine/threonine protein kinase [Polyangiaceae bacterium]|nr:serine/threonine protein kinase [Polyangiaceae bacterium]